MLASERVREKEGVEERRQNKYVDKAKADEKMRLSWAEWAEWAWKTRRRLMHKTQNENKQRKLESGLLDFQLPYVQLWNTLPNTNKELSALAVQIKLYLSFIKSIISNV